MNLPNKGNASDSRVQFIRTTLDNSSPNQAITWSWGPRNITTVFIIGILSHLNPLDILKLYFSKFQLSSHLLESVFPSSSPNICVFSYRHDRIWWRVQIM